MLLDRVAAAIDRLAPARSVGVAVSGGADSVFLLLALHSVDRAAAILHVNHKLRAAASDADEAFVRELAARLNLPCVVTTAPIATGNTEQEARRARYRFFLDSVAQGHCTHVATAHTLDDQAETVLQRFLRGSGTAGLSGIRPKRGPVIRPLLELRRAEIRAWLEANNHAWREDLSNLDPSYQRNRIRSRHLPDLASDLNPALPEVLAATARWAQGEEDYWSRELATLEPQLLTTGHETVLLRRDSLLNLPIAVQRRLLRRAIEIVRGSLRSIDFRHIDAIRTLLSSPDGSGRLQIPGLDIYRSFDWLRLAPPGYDARTPRDFQTTLVVPGRTILDAPPVTLELEQERPSAVYTHDGHVVRPERDRLKPDLIGELVLRNWRPGDRYWSFLTTEPEKIKTLFQKFRVPLWERRTWPVVTLGVETGPIVWSRDFGVAREFAAEPGALSLVIREPEKHGGIKSRVSGVTSL